MKKRSKRFKKLLDNFKTAEISKVKDVIELIKKNSNAKFDESIEFHIKTNADPKHADQQLRETTDLPNGTGKEIKILVFK